MGVPIGEVRFSDVLCVLDIEELGTPWRNSDTEVANCPCVHSPRSLHLSLLSHILTYGQTMMPGIKSSMIRVRTELPTETRVVNS
jgi:hypothetical protein